MGFWGRMRGCRWAKEAPVETLRKDDTIWNLYKTRHEFFKQILYVCPFLAVFVLRRFWNDTKMVSSQVSQNFFGGFGGATWSKFAPGTCESCPSWCGKGNWRGAANANFLRPDGQMDGLFLRFEEGTKKGAGRKTQPPFFSGVFLLLGWLIKSQQESQETYPQDEEKIVQQAWDTKNTKKLRNIISIWSFKTSPAIYIRGTKNNPNFGEVVFLYLKKTRCLRLREVSKLPWC